MRIISGDVQSVHQLEIRVFRLDLRMEGFDCCRKIFSEVVEIGGGVGNRSSLIRFEDRRFRPSSKNFTDQNSTDFDRSRLNPNY